MTTPDARVRASEPSQFARSTLLEQKRRAEEQAKLLKLPTLVDLSGLQGIMQDLKSEAQATRALMRCMFQILEQNYGALEDEQVWLPFAINVPAGQQVVASAVVDSDSVFYYRGYGATSATGVSFIEVIDGKQGAEHFRPPSTPSDTAGYQYGMKGKRVFGRVDIVIANSNAAPVSIDGFFLGRFRKGGR